MVNRLSFGFALLLSATTAMAWAAPPPQREKAPWAWSLDERLAERFASALRQKQAQPNDRPPSYSIRGRETPQLFLEWELFDVLIERGFPEYRGHHAASRQAIMEKAATLGFGADFWARVERVAATFIRVRRENMELGRNEAEAGIPDEQSARDSIALCRARYEALVAAKEEFGEERLLRLLYTVVAQPISHAYLPDDEANEETNLRFIEGGCR